MNKSAETDFQGVSASMLIDHSATAVYIIAVLEVNSIGPARFNYAKPQYDSSTWSAVASTAPRVAAWPLLRYASANNLWRKKWSGTRARQRIHCFF